MSIFLSMDFLIILWYMFFERLSLAKIFIHKQFDPIAMFSGHKLQTRSLWVSHSQIENIDRPQFSYNSVTLKKKTIMQSTFVIFASILAMASATAIKFEKPEERTFLDTTINSNNFLALNGTVLTLAVAGLLVLVVAVLLATGGFDPAKITQRYGSEYDQFYQTAEDAFSQTRYRRSAGNGKAEFSFLN